MKKFKLGNCASFINGYPFKPTEWEDKGLPIIRIQNLNNESAKYNYFGGKLSEKYLIKNGDILISWSASLGVYEWSNEDAYLNQHIFKVVFDKIEIDKYYFKYLISMKIDEMIESSHGSGMKHITKKDFDKIDIILHPLITQHQIVSELDSLSDIITKKKKQLAELDKLAQATFYDMFGDPVSNEKRWEKGTIIDFAECIVPSRNKPKSFTGDIPWITTKDLVHLGKTNRDYYFLSEAEIKEVQAKKIPAGSILMTCVGDLGVISIAENTMVINQQLHSFQCNKELNNIFAMFVISFYKEYMYKIATSTTVPYLNKKACNSVPMLLPPITLQTQFAAKIESIESQKNLINQSIVEVQQLFDYTMDKYFN